MRLNLKNIILRDYVSQITNGIVGDYQYLCLYSRNGTFIKKYSLVQECHCSHKMIGATEEVHWINGR